MFGENIRLRSINAERTRCLNYCRQTNRCRNDARLLTRAMWILNWRYGFHARSSLLQLAAFPRGGLTPAEAPLIDAEILFRQPQPPKVKLDDGLCVLPIALVDEFVRDWGEWRREFAVAVESGRAVLGFGWAE